MSPTIRTSSDLRRALAAEVEIARGLPPSPEAASAMAALANAITYSLQNDLDLEKLTCDGRWDMPLWPEEPLDGKPDG